MKKTFIFVFLFLLASTITNSEEVEEGNIVLCGGGPIPVEVFKWVVDHKPLGKCLLISQHNAITNKWLHLKELGQDIELIGLEELTVEKLKGVGAILLDGGSQYEYITKMNAEAIQMAHNSGVLILGTSAGAMILGEFYFSAQHGSISSEEACANPNEERICIGSRYVKIGCLRNHLIDSHYRDRQREGRLKVFIKKAGPDVKGIGIDESNALCITSKGKEVIGGDGVHYMKQGE